MAFNDYFYSPFSSYGDSSQSRNEALGFYTFGTSSSLQNTTNFHLAFNKERDVSDDVNSSSTELYKVYSGLGREKSEGERLDYLKRGSSISRTKYTSGSATTSYGGHVDIYREVGRALARNAFTAFSGDIYSTVNSGTNAIKRIIGDFQTGLDPSFSSAKTFGLNDEFAVPLIKDYSSRNDIRTQQYEKYLATNTYRYLFQHDTLDYQGKSFYGGLSILNLTPDALNQVDEMERNILEYGSYTLNSIIREDEYNLTARVSRLHSEFIRTNPEAIRSKWSNRVFSDPQESARDLQNRLSSSADEYLSSRDYISKPGIRAAIAIIESSTSSLTIDLFQLQNKAVIDVLVNKLRTKKQDIKEGKFQVSVRLAAPTSNLDKINKVGNAILGPNIIAMERLRKVRDEIIEDAISGNQTSSQTAIMTEQILSTWFSLQFVDKGMYHAKVYTTDRVGIIGSFNLTSPVGNSPNQAGSNYEEIYMFHNRVLERYNDRFGSSTSTDPKEIRSVAKRLRESYKTLSSQASDSERARIQKDIVESHLFLQTRSLAFEGLDGREFTGGQIGLAGDTGVALRTLIDYVSKPYTGASVRELYANLNQVWMLQLDNSLYYGEKGDYSGEFGGYYNEDKVLSKQVLNEMLAAPGSKGGSIFNRLTGRYDSSLDDLTNRGLIYRRDIQDKLFDLLAEGKAYVSVDIRNYRDRVVKPMESKIDYLIGRLAISEGSYFSTDSNQISILPSDFTTEQISKIGRMRYLQDYGGSIYNLAASVGFDNVKLQEKLGLNKGGINQLSVRDPRYNDLTNRINELNDTDANRTTKQLLAMARGGIIGVTESMSHVKNVFAVERGIGSDLSMMFKGLISVSSNFGRESTKFTTDDSMTTSTEAGLNLISSSVTNREDNDLSMSGDMENFALSVYGRYAEQEWRRLTGTQAGAVQTSLNSTRAVWESRVNRIGLNELSSRLDRLNRDVSSGDSNKLIDYTPIYGQGGDITALQLSVNIASLLDRDPGGVQASSPTMKFRVTYLNGGLSSKSKITDPSDPRSKADNGFIYLIDQNKVIGNAVFVNNSNSALRGLPFGDNYMTLNQSTGEYEFHNSVLEKGASLKLNPIDHLISVMSTLSSETAYRSLIGHPLEYLTQLSRTVDERTGVSKLGDLGIQYLEFLTKGHRSSSVSKSEDFLRNMSDSDFLQLTQAFKKRHLIPDRNDAGIKALQLRGGYDIVSDMNQGLLMRGNSPINNGDYVLRRALEGSIISLHSLNRKIKDPDQKLTSRERRALRADREDTIVNIKKLFDTYLGVGNDPTNYQADIGLGLLQMKRDFMYQDRLNTMIKQVKSSLLEPFISMSQGSTYGSSQAWFRTPLYGISASQSIFTNTLEQSLDTQDSLFSIFKYSLAQGLTYGPMDTLGDVLTGAIRGVADGGSVSEGVEDFGLSMYGLKKTPVGDVTTADFGESAGVGGLLQYDEYRNSLYSLIINKARQASEARKYGSILKPQELKLADMWDLNTSPQDNSFLDTNKVHNYIESGAYSSLDIVRKVSNTLQSSSFYSTDESGMRVLTNHTLLAYQFNVSKKASQIPQRLKNVLGSRPMYELDNEVAYRLRTKGDIGSYTESIVNNRRLELINLLVDRNASFSLTSYGIDKQQLMDQLRLAYESIPAASASNLRIIEEALSNIRVPNKYKSELSNTLSKAFDYTNQYINDMTSVSLSSGAGFRSFLTSDLIDSINRYKTQLIDEFKFSDDDFYKENSIARFLLLSNARLADMIATGKKGYTGARADLNPIALVRLGGDYTDFAIGNPYYGTDTAIARSIQLGKRTYSSLTEDERSRVGTMSGFIERAEKRQKASMMAEDYTVANIKVKAKDIVTFDPDSNRILVWGDIGSLDRGSGMMPRETIDMLRLTNDDKTKLIKSIIGTERYNTSIGISDSGKYFIKGSMDSRDQVEAIVGVIDNFRTIDDLPNVSTLERQTWYRNAEKSIEYVISSKQLMANADNNQLMWEFMYNRAFELGGSRRIEGVGVLAKAPMKIASAEAFYKIEGNNVNLDFFSYLIYQLNQQKGGAYGDIELKDVFGLLSSANLKSYPGFAHGSAILRDKNLLSNLLDMSINETTGTAYLKYEVDTGKGKRKAQQLAAGILTAFGDSWVSSSANPNIKTELKASLFHSAMKGDLGVWYRNQALTAFLSSDSAMKVIKNLSSDGSLESLTGLFSKDINSMTDYERKVWLGLSSELGGTLISKAKDAFSIHQTPSLPTLIDPELLNKALRGEGDALFAIQKELKFMLFDRFKEANGGRGLIGQDYININDRAQKEAAMLATSLDLTLQLSNQNKLIDIPTEFNVQDDRIVLLLASIRNDYNMDVLERAVKARREGRDYEAKEEIQYLELTRAAIRGAIQSTPIVRLSTHLMASQSKLPIGSKLTAKTEFQHLIKPLNQNIQAFEQGGKLSELRSTLSKVMAIVGEGETIASISGELNKAGFDRSSIYSVSDIRTANQISRNKFLGIYNAYSVEGSAALTRIKKAYSEYGQLVSETSVLLMKHIGELRQKQDTDPLLTQYKYKNSEELDTNIRFLQNLLTIDPSSNILSEEMNLGYEGRSYTGREVLLDIYSKLDQQGRLPEGFKDRAIDILNKLDIQEAIDVNRLYGLDSDKPFGIGATSPIIDGLNYKSFAFSLPSFDLVPGEGGTGQKVKFNYDNEVYSYLLSGSDLKVMGDQYGTYVDALISKTIFLASAYTPGTQLSNVRDKMMRARMSGTDEVTLDKDEMLLLQRWYKEAAGESGVLRLMAATASASNAQSMLAGKNSYPGAVQVSTPSWLVPPGYIVQAEEAMRRHSMGYSNQRAQALNASTELLAKFDLDNQQDPLYRKYLETMQSATLQGMSETGYKGLASLSSSVENYRSQVKNLLSKRGQPGVDEQIIRLNKVINDEIRKYESFKISADAKGDEHLKFAALVSLRELQNSLMSDFIIDRGMDTDYNTQALIEAKKSVLTKLKEDSNSLIDIYRDRSRGNKSELEKQFTHLGLTQEDTVADLFKNRELQLQELRSKYKSTTNFGKVFDDRVNYLGRLQSSLFNSISDTFRSPSTSAMPLSSRNALSNLAIGLSIYEGMYGDKPLINAFDIEQSRRKAVGKNPDDFMASSFDVLLSKLRSRGELSQQELLSFLHKSAYQAMENSDSLRYIVSGSKDLFKDQTLFKASQAEEFRRQSGLISFSSFLEDFVTGSTADSLTKWARLTTESIKIDLTSGEAVRQHKANVLDEIKQVYEDFKIEKKRLLKFQKDLKADLKNIYKASKDMFHGTKEMYDEQIKKSQQEYTTRVQMFAEGIGLEGKDIAQILSVSIHEDRPALLQGLAAPQGKYWDISQQEMRDKFKSKSRPFALTPKEFFNEMTSEREKLQFFSYAISKHNEGFRQVAGEYERRARETFNTTEEFRRDVLGISVEDESRMNNNNPLYNLTRSLDILTEMSESGRLSIDKVEELHRYMQDARNSPSDRRKKSGFQPLDVFKTFFGADINTVKANREHYEDPNNISLRANALLGTFNTVMNTVNSSDLLEVLAFRSPPFGGTEQQKQSLQVIQDLGLLNNYVRNLEQGSDQKFFRHDEQRGASLSMISPLSFLTMNLGDFDGDQYTTLYSNMSDLVRTKSDLQIKIEYKRNALRMGRGTERFTSAKGGRDEEGLQKYEQGLRDSITRLEGKVNDIDYRLKSLSSEMKSSNFSKAVRKEVSNYLGISRKYFESTLDGGYRDDTIDTDIMFTYVQQGRELFPAFEDTRTPDRLRNVIFDLLTSSSAQPTVKEYLSTGNNEDGALKEFKNIIDNLAKSKAQSENEYTYLSFSILGDDAQKQLMNELRNSLSTFNPTNQQQQLSTERLDEIKASYVSSQFYTRHMGLPGLQSILSQGAGVAMETTAYDMLVRVMGNAGGNILGKTYNTLVGTLYADSPLMAMAHVLKEDEVVRSIKQFMPDHSNDIDLALSTLTESSERAEQLQSFMKNINQALRDGIKPKGGSELINQMKSMAAQYEQADEVGRNKLITSLSSAFGPSGSAVGMNAFMELNTLISKRDTLLGNEVSDNMKILQDVGTGEFYSKALLDFYNNVEKGKSSGLEFIVEDLGLDKQEFDRVAKHINRISDRQSLNVFDVAATRVTRNLQAFVLAYRYNHSTGAEGLEGGTANTYMEDIYRSTINRYRQENSSNGLTSQLGSSRNIGVSSGVSTYETIGSLNHIEEVDRWVKSKFSPDMYKQGTTSFKDAEINRYMLSTMLGTGGTDSNLSREEAVEQYLNDPKLFKERAVLLAEVENIKESTSGLFGETGSNLYRFAGLEKTRQVLESQAGGSGRVVDPSLAGELGSDMWNSLMTLAARGKLNEKSTAIFYNTFVNVEGLNQINSLDQVFSTLVSGWDNQKGESLYSASGVPSQKETHMRKFLFGLLEKEGEFTANGITYGKEGGKGFRAYMEASLKATSTAARADAVNSFFSNVYKDSFGAFDRSDPESLIKGILNTDEMINSQRDKAVDNLKSKGITNLNEEVIMQEQQRLASQEVKDLTSSYNKALEYYKKSQIESHNQQTDPRLPSFINQEVSSRMTAGIMQRAEVTAQRLSAGADLFLPALLTLGGAAILGGRLDEEVVGDVVGSTLLSAAYMKPMMRTSKLNNLLQGASGSFGSRRRGIGVAALSGFTSGGFKMNMAMQESNGDVGKAVAITFGREVGFALGSMVISPMIESTTTELFSSLARTANKQREMHKAAHIGKLSQEAKRRFLLSSATEGALDVDDYRKVRAASSTLSGAILSGVIGMAMAGIGGQMAANTMEDGMEGLLSPLDAAIGAINNYKNRVMAQSANQYYDRSIFTEDGTDVPIEEVHPVEEYYQEGLRDEAFSADEVLYLADQSTVDYQLHLGEQDYSNVF